MEEIKENEIISFCKNELSENLDLDLTNKVGDGIIVPVYHLKESASDFWKSKMNLSNNLKARDCKNALIELCESKFNVTKEDCSLLIDKANSVFIAGKGTQPDLNLGFIFSKFKLKPIE